MESERTCPNSNMRASYKQRIACVLRVVVIQSFVLLGKPALGADIKDWRSAIDAIVLDLETVHPNAFGKIDHTAFRAQADALKSALPKLTEEQRMVRAMQLVSVIGDGHTQLSPDRRDFALWYPIRLYEFTDGYFVTAAYKSDADLVGAQISEDQW